MSNKHLIEKDINTLTELKITYVNPKDLFPNNYNPNRQNKKEFELLKKSIKEDGFTQPIVANRIDTLDKGIIVDGEHRWKAAQELGLESIPVVFVEMSQIQAQIATLRHNRARGNEDANLLTNLFADLERLNAFEWVSDSLMIDRVEWDSLLVGTEFDGIDGTNNVGNIGDSDSNDTLPNSSNSVTNNGDKQTQKQKSKNTDESADRESVENDKKDSEEIDYTESARAESGKQNVDSIINADATGESTVSTSTQEDIQRRQQTRQTYTKGNNRNNDRSDTSNKPMQDSTSYHINLLFTGDDAELVSSILGTDPSAKIIELCSREAQASR